MYDMVRVLGSLADRRHLCRARFRSAAGAGGVGAGVVRASGELHRVADTDRAASGGCLHRAGVHPAVNGGAGSTNCDQVVRVLSVGADRRHFGLACFAGRAAGGVGAGVVGGSGELHRVAHLEGQRAASRRSRGGGSGSCGAGAAGRAAAFVRRDAIASDVPAVHFQGTAAHRVAHVALDHLNVGAGHTLHNADMIRPAGIVADAGVVPVVENDVAGLRDVGVVFLPCSELLEKLDHLAAPALGRDNAGQAALDRHSRHEGGAPCVRVLHRVASGEWLVPVVNVNDLAVAAVGFFAAYIRRRRAYKFLSVAHAVSSFLLSGRCRAPGVAVELVLFDLCLIVHKSGVHVHVAGDTGHAALAGALPHVEGVARISGRGRPLGQPEVEAGERLHVQTIAGPVCITVKARIIARSLQRGAERRHHVREGFLSEPCLRLVLNIEGDRVEDPALIPGELLDHKRRLLLCALYIQGVAIKIAADGDPVRKSALDVFLVEVIHAAGRTVLPSIAEPDHGKLYAVPGYLGPVDRSLPLGNVDPFDFFHSAVTSYVSKLCASGCTPDSAMSLILFSALAFV